MVQLRMPIRMFTRMADDDDDRCGEHLAEIAREAMLRGSRGAAAVVVRASRTDLIDLRGVFEAKIPLRYFLAGLTRSEIPLLGPVLAVGLVGRFEHRNGIRSVPVTMAFLEWSDCRWWQWSALLDGEGQIVADSDTRRRAIDGDPLPSGLGRWWTLGRRTRSAVQYGAPVPEADPAALVH